jgi:hypothetical protein
MPLLQNMADLLSNNQLVSGVIDEIIDRDDLFAVLPFVGVNGKAYVYNRELAFSTIGSGVDFLSPNDAVNEGAATFATVTAHLKILAGDVDVDKFLQSTESDTNDQMAVQIAKKAKAVGKAFHQTLATGDTGSNAKAFDGLAVLAAGAQTDVTNNAASYGSGANQLVSAGTNGGALTLTMLDQLVDTVPNGPDVIVMRRGTIRAFRALLRATYGTDAVMQQLENFGRPMLTHNGIPVIMNEFLSGTEVQGTSGATTCSVYALRLNEADGLHGLYGGGNAGLVVENIGTPSNCE